METSPELHPNDENRTKNEESGPNLNKDGGENAQNLNEGTGETASGEENRPKSPPEKCAICLSTPENRSYTDSCYHEFCFVCLLEWSKIKAECPLCKQKFKNIIHNIRSMSDYDEYEVKPTTSSAAQAQSSSWNMNMNPNLVDSFGYDEHGNRFRYNSTMTAERMELIRHIRELQTRLNNLRRTQDNEYRLRKERERLERLNHLYRRSANRPESFTTTIEFRRMIYERGLRVRTDDVVDQETQAAYRETGPEFYRNNPAQMHRLIRWLHRELNVFFNGRMERVNFVCEFICYLLTHYEITSEQFKHRLGVVLMQNTDHFIHEFYNFARSPYEMDQYDRRARYERAPAGSGQSTGASVVTSGSGTSASASGSRDLEPITLSPSPSPSSTTAETSTLHDLAGPSTSNNSRITLEHYRQNFETTLANLRKDVNSAKARLNGLRSMNSVIQSFLTATSMTDGAISSASTSASAAASSSQSQQPESDTQGQSQQSTSAASGLSLRPPGIAPSIPRSRDEVDVLSLSDEDSAPGPSSMSYDLFGLSPPRDHVTVVSSDSSTSDSDTDSDAPIIDNTILMNDCLMLNETIAKPVRRQTNPTAGRESPHSTYLSSGASSVVTSPFRNKLAASMITDWPATRQQQVSIDASHVTTETAESSHLMSSQGENIQAVNFRRRNRQNDDVVGRQSDDDVIGDRDEISLSPSPLATPIFMDSTRSRHDSSTTDPTRQVDEEDEAVFSAQSLDEDDNGNESLEVVDHVQPQRPSPMLVDQSERKNSQDDVEVVAVLKPKRMRTPEIIKIDSDSEFDQSQNITAAEKIIKTERSLDDEPGTSRSYNDDAAQWRRILNIYAHDINVAANYDQSDPVAKYGPPPNYGHSSPTNRNSLMKSVVHVVNKQQPIDFGPARRKSDNEKEKREDGNDVVKRTRDFLKNLDADRRLAETGARQPTPVPPGQSRRKWWKTRRSAGVRGRLSSSSSSDEGLNRISLKDRLPNKRGRYGLRSRSRSRSRSTSKSSSSSQARSVIRRTAFKRIRPPTPPKRHLPRDTFNSACSQSDSEAVANKKNFDQSETKAPAHAAVTSTATTTEETLNEPRKVKYKLRQRKGT